MVSGQVFRSGEMSELTATDLGTLESIGIRRVIDLRSEQESAARPDRLPPAASYVAIRLLPGTTGSAVEEILKTGELSAFPPWADVYRSAVREHATAFASLLRMVADPRGRPVVFHCTTGKDRTGIAAALLLSLLGVGWEEIEEDFLRSNDLLRPHAAHFVDRMLNELDAHGVRIGEEARGQFGRFLEVDASYLAAARREMIALNGSVDSYIRESLGIGETLTRALRDQLLV